MPVTLNSHPAQAQGEKAKAKAPAMLVPFVRAAKEHYEQFIDESRALTASAQTLGPYDLPAYGFVRGIVLEVEASGATGTPTMQEDAPWSVIDEISVIDVNGAPIYGPVSGHEFYLTNKFGGYRSGAIDPRQSPVYVAPSAAGNFRYMLRVPLEINSRDALGALANQNAASTYKLRITLAPNSKVYSVQPGAQPTIRIRAHLDAWTQPTQADLRGNQNATEPPARGTTQYWSKTTFNVASGYGTYRLPRVGNYIRNLMFVWRAAADGKRSTGVGSFPDPVTLSWDTRVLKNFSRTLWQHDMACRTDFVGAAEAIGGLDNGVFVEDYMHEFTGRLGYELRDGWLPTTQSTRLEISGTFGAAGTLTVLTNDVAPAGEIFV